MLIQLKVTFLDWFPFVPIFFPYVFLSFLATITISPLYYLCKTSFNTRVTKYSFNFFSFFFCLNKFFFLICVDIFVRKMSRWWISPLNPFFILSLCLRLFLFARLPIKLSGTCDLFVYTTFNLKKFIWLVSERKSINYIILYTQKSNIHKNWC